MKVIIILTLLILLAGCSPTRTCLMQEAKTPIVNLECPEVECNCPTYKEKDCQKEIISEIIKYEQFKVNLNRSLR